MNNKNEAADLATIVKKTATLTVQFIALSKQLQQSSEARNERRVSKRRDSIKEVGKKKPVNKRNRKQDSSKEDEVSIHALATAASSLDDDVDDFRDNSKGTKWKEESEKDAKLYSFETTSLRRNDKGNEQKNENLRCSHEIHAPDNTPIVM